MTNTQKQRINDEIKKLNTKLKEATEKLNRTLEIIKEDESWRMFLEEDIKRVEYYKRHINRLNSMI